VHRLEAAFKTRPRVYVFVHINCVSHLLGPNLRVHVEFFEKATVRPPHHLKVRPLKTDRPELRRKVPAQQLSFRTGVVSLSEGNTQAVGEGSTEDSRHS